MTTLMRVALEGWSPAGRATWVQVATDGAWEDSRGLDAPAAAADVRSLVREAGEGDVAVEFEWLGHPLVFVGARRGPGEAGAFEDAAAEVAEASPADPTVALAMLAGGTPVDLDHVELGAANAWKSVGPLRIWSRREPPFEGDVEALLDARPDLRTCTAPVALEVAFGGPRICWIGREISRPEDDRHLADPQALEALLRGMFEPAG